MGSQQSSTAKTSNKPENRKPAASPQDLQRPLKHQIMMTEQKTKKIMNEKRTETTAPASSQNDVHASTSQQQQPSSSGLKIVNEFLENAKQVGAAASAVSYRSPRSASQQQSALDQRVNQWIEKAQVLARTHQQPTPTVKPAASPQDLQRPLKHQIMMSEQKTKKIMNEKRTETTAPASSQNDVHAPTGQQQQPSSSGLKNVNEFLENANQVGAAASAVSYRSPRSASQQQSAWDQRVNQWIEKAQVLARTHQQPTPTVKPAASPQDLQRPLKHQIMMSEQKTKKIMNEKRTAPASSQNDFHTGQQQQPSITGWKKFDEVLENAGVERQRKLYSYNQNDLPSPTTSNSDSLYPNLRNAYSASPPGNNNTGSPVNQPYGAGPKLYSAPPGDKNMGYPVNQPYGAGPKLYSEPQGNDNMGSPVNQPYGAGPKLYSAPQGNNNVDSPVYRPYGPGFGSKVYTNSSYKDNHILQSSRSRSQSRQRGDDNEVNCATCGQIIYQCDQKHTSCEVCKTLQMACGACSLLQVTARRNSDLEKYFMERKVRCPNSRDGCQLFIKMGDMAIHEKKCPFQALQCPSLGSNCNWKGKLSLLAEHFKEMHPLHNQGEVDKEMFMSNVTNNSHTMYYVQIGPYNFLFHIKVSEPDARVYMAAQLIGTKHSAAKWAYEIHIYDKNEPRRKYQCVERCSSANHSLQELISSTQCAVIPQNYVKTFICGGTVAYKFYIKRDDPKAHETAAERDNSCGPQQRHHFKKFVKKH